MNIFKYFNTMRERKDTLAIMRSLRPYVNHYYMMHVWYKDTMHHMRELEVPRRVSRVDQLKEPEKTARTIVASRAIRYMDGLTAFPDLCGVIKVIAPKYIMIEPITKDEYERENRRRHPLVGPDRQ